MGNIHSDYNTWLKNEIVNPVNSFIISFNILFFLIVLFIFFWYVLSVQFEVIILNKTELITLYAQNDPSVNQAVTAYVQSINLPELQAAAEADETARNKSNLNLLIGYPATSNNPFPVFVWYIILSIVTFGLFIWLCVHAAKNGLTSGDKLLLFLLVLSFITEVIFYFAVVNTWEFIGDYEILKTFMT